MPTGASVVHFMFGSINYLNPALILMLSQVGILRTNPVKVLAEHIRVHGCWSRLFFFAPDSLQWYIAIVCVCVCVCESEWVNKSCCLQ